MDFLITFLVSSIISLTFMIVFGNELLRQKKPNPPSPWKLPFLGNLHHLIGNLPPHQILRNLAQKYGPLMHLQIGEISALVVSSPPLAEKILKTHDLSFSNRAEFLILKITMYGCSDIAFSQYGEYWRQMRKICIVELLSPKNVRSFASIRRDEALNLIASLKAAAAANLGAGGNVIPINLTERIREYTSCMVSRAAFGGVSKEIRKAFVKLLKDSASRESTLDVVDLFPSFKILHPIMSRRNEMMKMREKFDEVLDRIIDQHCEKFARTKQGMGDSGQEDLVDVLLRVKESGDLQVQISNDNIKAIIMDVFIGATENPSTIMEWAMSEMIRNPNVMAKAQDEIRKSFRGKGAIQETDFQDLKYLMLVIKETLRLHPVLPILVGRKCREECEIDGYKIAINTMAMINVWAIGRDPEYWDDPESFKPERFENISADFTGTNFKYLPFGAGRRVCPGISFGLANVELALALLLYHFDWKLPNGLNSDDLDMSETVGITVTRKNDLQLLATLYEDPTNN
ncbi:OLC1v1005683C1 [Oldenlandia corymbosa var. corymbosa]|uniref:OLC1v1005683C1 n=1 Tax=Oldenlandia corymbosa var. corymbosa TaxID=529605 RepID=A0AAV1DF50_OLDCO|nr:OLC1v1005683C1 [Oldenlandia corymbosa var. corymbosa]